MSAKSNVDVLDAISNMSVMEIVDLIKAMEEKFNVTAAAPVVAVAAAAGATAAVEEKTDFNIHMTSFGANKVGVIKVVREITGLGLKEAKDLVEAVPSVVKEGVDKEEAAKIKKSLEEAGAAVEIK